MMILIQGICPQTAMMNCILKVENGCLIIRLTKWSRFIWWRRWKLTFYSFFALLYVRSCQVGCWEKNSSNSFWRTLSLIIQSNEGWQICTYYSFTSGTFLKEALENQIVTVIFGGSQIEKFCNVLDRLTLENFIALNKVLYCKHSVEFNFQKTQPSLHELRREFTPVNFDYWDLQTENI